MSTPETDDWGIEPEYHDGFGQLHRVTPETRAALWKAMNTGSGSAPANGGNLLFASPHSQTRITEPAELTLESGEKFFVETELPPDLPLGYHDLRFSGDHRTRLIIAPRACYLPPALHTWGWTIQLYALRSRGSWGIGDFTDLRKASDWAARETQAGVIMVNPLWTAKHGLPQQASPYYPSSRRFRNVLYLRIEELPCVSELQLDLDRLASAGHALNKNRLIDRDAVYRLKMEALEKLWELFTGDAAFDDYCFRQGRDLQCFAAFQVASERFDSPWQRWPLEFRQPSGPGMEKILSETAERVRFFMWIQWHLDRQFAGAARLPIIQDLPVGFDPDGFDAWQWQEVMANGVTIGAPADPFNSQGQDWGLPPFSPRNLRAAGYEPFIQTLRASLEYSGGLRIDHVMGLFRLFWIPVGNPRGEGAYIRYNSAEMLAILALESQRAKAFIIGEDLGTVPPGAREILARHAVLSYRLLWFEPGMPAQFPRETLAAVSTHDLPTISGIWSGMDLEHQRRAGLEPNRNGASEMLDKLKQVAGLGEGADRREVIRRTYTALSSAPSRIVVASFDDALAVEERPNIPAMVNDNWPNWSISLPSELEDIYENYLVRAVADSLNARRGKTNNDVSAGAEPLVDVG